MYLNVNIKYYIIINYRPCQIGYKPDISQGILFFHDSMRPKWIQNMVISIGVSKYLSVVRFTPSYVQYSIW